MRVSTKSKIEIKEKKKTSQTCFSFSLFLSLVSSLIVFASNIRDDEPGGRGNDAYFRSWTMGLLSCLPHRHSSVVLETSLGRHHLGFLSFFHRNLVAHHFVLFSTSFYISFFLILVFNYSRREWIILLAYFSYQYGSHQSVDFIAHVLPRGQLGREKKSKSNNQTIRAWWNIWLAPRFTQPNQLDGNTAFIAKGVGFQPYITLLFSTLFFYYLYFFLTRLSCSWAGQGKQKTERGCLRLSEWERERKRGAVTETRPFGHIGLFNSL